MAYGNYAPFYRAGFFNPMQAPVQNMTEMQNQFAQPYQAVSNGNTPTNDMIWVLNETEATSYPVAPNNSVTLWDKNRDTVYIKSVNMQGIPSMRILDYSERMSETSSNSTEEHVCKCGDNFVSFEAFAALQEEFAALRNELDELKAKPKAKTAKKSEVEDGE